MRFLLPLLFCAGVMSVYGCASHCFTPVVGRPIIPQGTVSFTSVADGFAVWMPTKPIKIKDGKSIQWLYKTQKRPVNYVASFDPQSSKPEMWETHLNQIQRGMLLPLHSKLLKAQRLQINGYPGREVTISLGQGKFTFRSRFYFTPRGSYAVGAGGYNQPMQKGTPEINRVFESFRLLPQG